MGALPAYWQAPAVPQPRSSSGPAWPSPTDLAEAYYPDALAVIVSLAGATPQAAFALDGAEAREVPLLLW